MNATSNDGKLALNFLKKNDQMSGSDLDGLKKSVRALFEGDARCLLYEDVMVAGFAFGTGCNHESDDVIDTCLPYIEKVLAGEIDRHQCLRLEVNVNQKGDVGMLLAVTLAEKKAACLVVTSVGGLYLLEEATHKPYIFVLEDGRPLVTFASNTVNGGFKGEQPSVEMRGVFDGRHFLVSKQMTSCLPSKIRLSVKGNDYSSHHYQSTNGGLCFKGQTVPRFQSKKLGRVVVPLVTEM